MEVPRRLWFLASAALLGALLPSIAEAPNAPATAAPKDESVRIEQQIVRADATITSPERPPIPRRSVRRRYARNDADSGVMSRARRLLLGDGATRPEAFPTPR
jgi:hypothetical protein